MDIGLNGGHWMLLTHRGVERQGAYETHFNHKPKIYRTYTRTREKKREKGTQTQHCRKSSRYNTREQLSKRETKWNYKNYQKIIKWQ